MTPRKPRYIGFQDTITSRTPLTTPEIISFIAEATARGRVYETDMGCTFTVGGDVLIFSHDEKRHAAIARMQRGAGYTREAVFPD